MITTLQALKKALRTPKNKGGYCGVILYEGASMIDGAPIVAIANKILGKSANGKTGHMVQTWIIRSDVNPSEALKTGQDSSVCGMCAHRPFLTVTLPDTILPDTILKNGKIRKGKTVKGKKKGGDCYVNVGRAPLGVYKAYKNGRYLKAGVDFDKQLVPQLFRDTAFRIGSYGDPAAVPFQVWRAATISAAFFNGYTHQWKDARFQAFKLLCMASADSESEMTLAHSMGWRTFRVRGAQEPVFKGLESICPASKEMDYKTTCSKCKACGGTSAKARVSMVIISHGIKANNFMVTE